MRQRHPASPTSPAGLPTPAGPTAPAGPPAPARPPEVAGSSAAGRPPETAGPSAPARPALRGPSASVPRVPRPLPRREFLRRAGLGVVAIPYLGPLSRVGVDAGAAEGMAGAGAVATTPVAVVRTEDRAEGVRRAMGLLDLRRLEGRRAVVKPNFNSADPAPASTHEDTLVAVVRGLQEGGARSVTVGESSGPTDTRRVMETKGVFDLARDHRFEVVNYDEIPDGDWVRFGPDGTHWPEGFWLPRQVVDAEYLVSTCCLKTHGYGGVFTMSLKLSVGLTPKSIRRGMHRSPDMRRMIAELNLGYRPDLVVLDGVDAFVDGGPSSGELKRTGVVIAGHDRVAVDAVGLAALKAAGANAAIMDRGIFEQEQIARAVALGLGPGDAAGIRLVTPDAASRAYADRLAAILALG